MAKTSPTRTDPKLRAVFDLAQHLDSGRRIPDDSRQRLLDALHASIVSNFELSLWAALGIKSWGGVSPVNKVRLAGRDRRICRLWSHCPEWSALPPAAAAKAMALSAARYQSDRWPREQHHDFAPAAEPAATWWSLLRSGEKIPGERRLCQILHSEIQDAV